MKAKKLFLGGLLAAALALAACEPGAALREAARSVSPGPSASATLPGLIGLGSETPSASSSASGQLDPAIEAAIRKVIEQGNQEQQQAFSQRNPSVMRGTATQSYYDQLVQTNQDLADNGVTDIKLVKLEWGQITLTSPGKAEATTFETWRTAYTDGGTDESRDRNVYTLAKQGNEWKIQDDQHPDSGLNQPVPETAPPAPESPGRSTPPPPPQSGQSHNWSGYSAAGGKFTAVSGTWTVPQPAPGSFGVDAAWVGIGGIRSRDLIQAGTQETVSGTGRVSYQAWAETLPQVSHPVPLHVNPGDSVSVSIAEQRDGNWLISFKNNTNGETYQRQEQYRSSFSSAEWIEEAPSGFRGVLPLSSFGTVNFSQGSAIKDGKTVNIQQSGARPITMINAAGTPVAVPSALGPDGASFSVTRSEAATGGSSGQSEPRTRRRVAFWPNSSSVLPSA